MYRDASPPTLTGLRLLRGDGLRSRRALVTYGGEGYAYILENVVPLMQRKGLSADEIDAILVRNPARVLVLMG